MEPLPHFDAKRFFLIKTDEQYFISLDLSNGGNIVQDVRAGDDFITKCRPGDIALVITERGVIIAFYTVTKVTQREDQLATINSYDGTQERPHSVMFEDGVTTRLDFRRSSYEVRYQSTGEVVPQSVLADTLNEPLKVTIHWKVWKFKVAGEKIHLFDMGLVYSGSMTDTWCKQVIGSQKENIIDQIKNEYFMTVEFNKKRERQEEEEEESPMELFPKKDSPPQKKLRTTTEKSAGSSHSTSKPTKSATKTTSKATKAKKETKTTTTKTTTTKTTTTKTSKETSKKSKMIHLKAGTVIGIRGDDMDFVMAQVTEDINFPASDTTQEVPIRWYVEAREQGLRNYFCHPNWFATVGYGAVIHVGLKVEYVPHMDMYYLREGYDKLLKKL